MLTKEVDKSFGIENNFLLFKMEKNQNQSNHLVHTDDKNKSFRRLFGQIPRRRFLKAKVTMKLMVHEKPGISTVITEVRQLKVITCRLVNPQ